MADHRFDVLTHLCIGCDISAAEVRDADPSRGSRRTREAAAAKATCPASYHLVNDETAGVIEVIVAVDRAVIRQGGGEVLRLGKDARRALALALVDRR